MRRRLKGKRPGLPTIVAMAAGLLLAAWAIIVLCGDAKAADDSIWIEIRPPQEESRGQAIRMVCPVCGKCYPKQTGIGTCTAMFCKCCNVCDLSFTCRTYRDSSFTIKLGECDWIKWGCKVAKKDIDSLVDRDEWMIRNKNKKDK